MPYEKGPEIAGARRQDADFSHTRLHAPNFEGATITDAWLRNADISGDLEGLRLNGIEVAPLVEAERARLFPDLVRLRATDPPGLARAWELIESLWRVTVARARELDETMPHERVDDEWSFIETLRHLVLATDCWLRRMVLGIDHPYHPWGLAGSWLSDPASWGLEVCANPTLEDVLAARRGRMDEVAHVIANLTPEALDRVWTPPNASGHPEGEHTVLECLHVIFNEEWEHHRYATRDLEVLERG